MDYIEKLDYAIKQTQGELDKVNSLISTYEYEIERKLDANKIIDEWLTEDLNKSKNNSDNMSHILKKLKQKKVNEFNRLVNELLNN